MQVDARRDGALLLELYSRDGLGTMIRWARVWYWLQVAAAWWLNSSARAHRAGALLLCHMRVCSLSSSIRIRQQHT